MYLLQLQTDANQRLPEEFGSVAWLELGSQLALSPVKATKFVNLFSSSQCISMYILPTLSIKNKLFGSENKATDHM